MLLYHQLPNVLEKINKLKLLNMTQQNSKLLNMTQQNKLKLLKMIQQNSKLKLLKITLLVAL